MRGVGDLYDFTTGIERSVDSFPAPADLWARLNAKAPLSAPAAEKILAPYYPDPDRPPRYYQQIAINRAVEESLAGSVVKPILQFDA